MDPHRIAEPSDPDDPQCRICLENDSPWNLIAPCKCNGSIKWVHRTCVDQWRGTQSKRRRFTECQQCKSKYKLQRVAIPGELKLKIHCHLTAAIDVLVPILILIIIILILATVIRCLDPQKHLTQGLNLPFTGSGGPLSYCITLLYLIAIWAFISQVVFLILKNWDSISESYMGSSHDISIELILMIIYSRNLTNPSTFRVFFYAGVLGGLVMGVYTLKNKIQQSITERRKDFRIRQTDIYTVMDLHNL
jgi:hypothetical protein